MTTSPASFANPDDVARVAANLSDVRRRITSVGGDLAAITIVGVTKSFDVATLRAAAAAGVCDVGENYVNELETKRAAAPDLDVRWHFLGALQSNKIARIVRCADVISGVARAKEISMIARLRPDVVIDIQVDLTGGVDRNGAHPSEVGALVDLARREGLEVRGLMTVASPDASAARAQFAQVDALAESLGLAGRSMGMSDDVELAVEAGSTEVRVGRALFGPRPRAVALA